MNNGDLVLVLPGAPIEPYSTIPSDYDCYLECIGKVFEVDFMSGVSSDWKMRHLKLKDQIKHPDGDRTVLVPTNYLQVVFTI
jgi:hypothetical protein